jgi:protoporphyrinogen oxidase
MDIPGLVEYTNLRPMGNDHIVYVPFYMPGDHPEYQQPDFHFRDKVIQYFQKINPDLAGEQIKDLKVSRYRFAQPVCRPGFQQDLPDYRTEIPGLWIADTSYYYPHDRGISESIDFGRKLARESVQ